MFFMLLMEVLFVLVYLHSRHTSAFRESAYPGVDPSHQLREVFECIRAQHDRCMHSRYFLFMRVLPCAGELSVKFAVL